MAIKGIDIIRRWVIQTRLKEQGKQGGVMITLPKKDFVDLNTSITAERLMRNGIDPNSITSVNQVENIINQINKPRVISQGDPEFSGIMGRLTGSNIIKRDFGKPFKEEIEKMGSKELTDSPLDDFKPMQTDDAIKTRIESGNKKTLAKIKQRQKMLDDAIEDASPGFANDIKVDADLVAENLAERMGKVYDDLPTKERLDLYDQAYTGLSKQRFKGMRKPDDDPEDLATGGRVGFKMGRRAFLQAMLGAGAGLGAAKTGIFSGFGKGAGKQITEKAVESAGSGTPPPYFFKLVDKIKKMGDDVTEKAATKEREVVTEYKNYRLTEDVTTGEKTIQRVKMDDGNPQYYDEVLAEETYMNYKPGKGQTDEVTGKVADEYTEDTSYIRTSGPQKGEIYDTVDGVPEDVLEEIGEKKVISEKASGGIAGMINKRFDFDGGGSPLQRLRQSIVDDLLKNFPGIPEADLQIIVKDINLDMSPEEAQASMTANFSKLYGKAQGGIARMLGE